MSETRAADYSLRILWSLARWIEDQKGRAELDELAKAGGVEAKDFDGTTRWVSHEQCEKMLVAGLEMAGSEEELKKALAYRLSESYGAFRYMIWAVSQQRRSELAAKMSEKVATRVGKFEVLRSTPNEFAFRYTSTRPESRLLCLSRQVPWAYGPTVWGLPPSQLTETACIAKGDPYCEYHLRSFVQSGSLAVIAGAAIGAIVALAVWSSHAFWPAAVALPLAGAAIGYARELRRANALNLEYSQEINEVLRQLGEAEAETRSEIAALHQRQREWIQLMEQHVTDRTLALEQVVEGLQGVQLSRVSTLRGFSHDLRNPLFVLKGNTQFLRERIHSGDEGEALRDIELAVGQMEALIARLMEVATQDPGLVKMAPKPVSVPPLAETFRRRLRALVHGRDIKTSVFCTREAPDQIVIDPLVFDRVVDNLLTNAAKYTHRGSILLELSGTPATHADDPEGGFLTLKLSDTGEGIPAAQVERIFRPRAASEPSRPNSYGIGLSSVVLLLAQIGGRIDVMSKPGLGTTFWAHLPVTPPTAKRSQSEENLESMITRVVTIRRAEGT